MAQHNLFYYPYPSFTNAQLPLLKVAALYFDKPDRKTIANIPILDPQIPLQEVLKHRDKNKNSLAQVRATLGDIAKSIQTKPWSENFWDDIETKTLPALNKQLYDVWKDHGVQIEKQKSGNVLNTSNIAIGAALLTLGLDLSKTIPVIVSTLALTAIKDIAIPAYQAWKDCRDSKNTFKNGLNYFVELNTKN